MSTICDIPHHPYHQTKPNYKEINNDTAKNEIWVNPGEKCGNIHIDSIIDKSTRRQLHILFTVSFFYYNEFLMK